MRHSPTGKCLGNLIRLMAHHNADVINAARQKLVDDVCNDGACSERQQMLLPAHPDRLAGGRYDGTNHPISAFRRTAISWAAMLTAISGTVTAPIASPTGA